MKQDYSDIGLIIDAIEAPAAIVREGKVTHVNSEGARLFLVGDVLPEGLSGELKAGVYLATGAELGGISYDVAATPLSESHLLVFKKEKKDALTEGMMTVACAMQEPVNTIAASFDILKNSIEGTNEEVDRYISYTNKSMYALMRLQRSISDVASLEEGSAELDLTNINLDDMCSELCRDCGALTEMCGVTLTYKRGARNLVAAVDVYKVRRMILSLLSNAIAACNPGDGISLELSASDSSVVITVEDTGAGIPGGVLGTVFHRAGQKTLPSAEEKGAGLGMQFVKAVAELHGGRVVITRGRDSGTRVTVSVPRRRTEINRSKTDIERYGGYADVMVELSTVLPAQAFSPERV